MSTEAFALEIAQEVYFLQAEKMPPHVVGASFPFSEDMVLAVAKGLIEAAAKSYGMTVADAILAYGDKIRKVVGPETLASLDRVIHGLQDGS